MSYLYILDTDSLVIPFANIFFFGRLSFHFVDSLFCCEKDFKFNLVPFVYFLFLFHCLRRQVQKCIATICVKEYFMFSSRSCMVSGIKLTSLMHFYFLFFWYMMWGNVLMSFIFLCSCPIFPAPHTEELDFSPSYILDSFVKD